MATLKLTITPEKAAKDGSHKIRVAVGHKSVTRYIVEKPNKFDPFGQKELTLLATI